MSNRDYRLDFLAVTLAVGTVLLTVSLATFDRADPPSDYVYPPNEMVQNACGPLGARLATPIVELLGIASFPAVGTLVILTVAIFRRSSVSGTARSMSGAILSSLALAALLDRITVAETFQTIAGAGGSVGAIISHILQQHLSTVGSSIVLISILSVGIVLTFGSMTFVAALFAGQRLKSTANWIARCWSSLRASRKPTVLPEPFIPEPAPINEQDLDESDEEEFEEDEDEDAEEVEDELKIIRTGFDDPVLTLSKSLPAEFVSTNVKLPSLDILTDPEPFEHHEHESEIRERARLLEKTFAEFAMKVKVVQIDTGPVVTQYEIELEPGLRARKVIALADDIAIALKASSVRIVAPIPGKNTVGIEVPNAQRAKVTLKEVMIKSAGNGPMRLPMYLGKDVKGMPLVQDLATMPHLLIAGRTGTGKSVCLNALILSILMTKTPDEVKMLMIDPKMVELSLYKSIPHLMHPVVTDMKKAEAILAWAVEKMEERYALLAQVGVRHIDSYNALDFEEICDRIGAAEGEEQDRIPKRMPYILIFADEMADLMMTAAKEVEAHIIRLAQKSRAVGIHLILATQKPTVDVVTGLIKSNLPARIAFQVASRTDSRVVLDEMGAERLLGNGDMLFLSPGTSKITRAQGTFVSDQEVDDVVQYLSSQAKPQFSEEIMQVVSKPAADGASNLSNNRDEMYEAAVEVIIREQRGSVSMIQRALGLGYGRAARLIDYMAEDGIVGEYNGSQAREVLIKPDQWEEFRKQRFAKAS